ncbi:esterase/lipase family protein [Kitasatospora sp. NPDC101157]|uniref:esterase/lipase family protein n=1 Tax=Kitasatospora sp. NPDC101157 TaxID=3364098 RepID=UPI00381D702D
MLASLLATSAFAAPAVAAGPVHRQTARQAGTLPHFSTFPTAFVASLANPDADPPGANDWSCRPPAAHPRPVVLVHGTWENAFDNWNELAPELQADGYCVFAPNLGGRPGEVLKGKAHIPDSSAQLAAYADRVLAATGANQVDLVGHSQGGGVLPRWYLKNDGGADRDNPANSRVHQLIGISPSNHGTNLDGLVYLAKALGLLYPIGQFGGQALADQVEDSEVNRALDEGGDTMPGVSCTTIVTRYDEVVTPYDHQYLKPGPDAPVDNITLQDVCALDHSNHIGSSYDPIALRLVRNALDPTTAQQPDCLFIPPVFS